MRTEPASFAQTGIGAVHPGLGFAPCWGELLFLGQKANVVRRRRRKSPAPTMAPNSLRESGTHRIEFASLRQKTGAAKLASQARLKQVLALIRFWPARGGARKVADKAEPVRSCCIVVPAQAGTQRLQHRCEPVPARLDTGLRRYDRHRNAAAERAYTRRSRQHYAAMKFFCGVPASP